MGTAAPLKKYTPPSPSSAACIAAASGDTAALRLLSAAALTAHDEFPAGDYSLSGDSSLGDSLDAGAGEGNSPLIWAANEGHLEAVNFLITQQSTTSIDAQGYIGATALSRACRAGHAAVAEALIGAGAGERVGWGWG
jgi:hypothetical protein